MAIKIRIVKDSKKSKKGLPIGDELPADVRYRVDKFNRFFSLLGKRFIDRTDELEQIKYALLTQEHILLKGKPGTAKSQLGRSVFSNINGATNFEVQLSKFMSEDYLFGPINVKRLKEDGEIVHNTENTIVDATFAFIDEFFDGSDVLLRSLLEVLNERTFTRNTQKVKCGLHTAILTSNYSRDEEATEAILDRILFKSDVAPIGTAPGRMRMYKNALDFKVNGHVELEDKDKLDMKDINALVEYVQSSRVRLNETVLSLYDSSLKEYTRQSQKYVSDRTAVKMLKLLKACAVLHGRAMVLLEDIPMLRYSICIGNDRRDHQVWSAIVTKQITDRKKSAVEFNVLSALRDKYDGLLKEKHHARKELDSVIKIKKLTEYMEEVNDAAGRFEVDTSKQEAETLMDQIRLMVSQLKPECGDGGQQPIQQGENPFANAVLTGMAQNMEAVNESH